MGGFNLRVESRIVQSTNAATAKRPVIWGRGVAHQFKVNISEAHPKPLGNLLEWVAEGLVSSQPRNRIGRNKDCGFSVKR